jgi:drug/metabolite transporter (DMT)-like permease
VARLVAPVVSEAVGATAPRHHRASLLRLMAGAVLISFSAVFVKLTAVTSTVSGVYRCAFGGLILLLVLGAKREPLRLARRPWVTLLVGSLFFAADLAAWHRSIVLVGPGLGTLLANFQVFVLAFVGIVVFAERARIALLMSIPLAVVGLGLIVGFDWTGLPALRREGVLLGLATAVFYSGYILSLRRARQLSPGTSPISDLAIVSLATAVLLAALALAGGESLAIPTWRDGGVLLAYGLIGQVLGWVLISSGLERVPASLIGLILLLQPTLSFGWDIAFFALPMSATQALGAALAMLAIYAGSRR